MKIKGWEYFPLKELSRLIKNSNNVIYRDEKLSLINSCQAEEKLELLSKIDSCTGNNYDYISIDDFSYHGYSLPEEVVGDLQEYVECHVIKLPQGTIYVYLQEDWLKDEFFEKQLDLSDNKELSHLAEKK